MKPLIAIVGRPNVGKSRLFNRMISEKKAIVIDLPGTTRDAIYDTSDWRGVLFDLVDTGGLTEAKDRLSLKIDKQVKQIINDAVLILFICDFNTGITSPDREIAMLIRKLGKKVLLIINKIDKPYTQADLAEFYQLGFNDMFGISAEHGYGIDDVMDAIVSHIKQQGYGNMADESLQNERIRLAFIGKPNAGKSSMLNYITGKELMIVDDTPGTTRDPVEVNVELGKKPFILIDTAGLRKGRRDKLIDQLVEIKTKKIIEKTDLGILVIDAVKGITTYDKKLIQLLERHGKAIVIALNKWDLLAKSEQKNTKMQSQYTSDYIPQIPTSTLTGFGINDLIKAIFCTSDMYNKRIITSELNKFFNETMAANEPNTSSGKIIKPYYIVQVSVKPPTFVLFVNTVIGIKENYKRFIMHRLRDIFGFNGVPIRVMFRNRH
ncbi:MAG: ribosome biogenesis GTPase Der [Deltaproteobacteria bacterium]|nr:ribosome biogenesis GTPase Der [Deltaproteobacteria bacterium]